MSEIFGKNLKEMRKERKLKQQDIADILTCTKHTISGWELNKQEPCIKDIIKLAKILNVTTDELLGCEEESYYFEYQHKDTKLIHKEIKG